MDELLTRPQKGLLIFFAVLAGGSAALQGALLRTGEPVGKRPLLILALMWTPALASLVARLALREGIRDVSFRWGGRAGGRCSLIGWLYPVAVGLPAYGAAWLAGLVPFAPPSLDLAGLAARPAGVRFVALLVLGLTGIFLVSLLSATGEEIGWRGYLLTRLVEAGIPRPVLVSSLIWGVWHLPLVLSGQYAAGENRLLSAAVFLVSVVAAGFVAAHLRLTSGSVWPAVVFHAAWNAVIQGVFDASSKGETYWVGESGLLVAGVSALLAALLVRGRWPARKAPGEEPFAEIPGLEG